MTGRDASRRDASRRGAILTVTPNTALDTVLFVEGFAFGETVRAQGVATGMGGKGAVTSWVLGQLGTPSVATGFAAGETGRRMEAMLRAAGVETDFLWVGGETRTNYVVARVADGSQGTVTASGLVPAPEDPARLRGHVEALLPEAAVLLCGGSLPAGMPVDWYAPLIARARDLGIPTLLDVSDQFLEPNVAARPTIITPNSAEASRLLGRPIATVAQAARGAEELARRGIAAVLITLGEHGAVAATDEGLYHVPPVPVRVVNTAGAGDAFNGGVIQARLDGACWAEALRWAGAVATAALLTPGTGEIHPEDVQALYPRVTVQRL
ncbi:MAG TPA: hexose kinase [Chloroflexi bacterium]|nr:hexose kinase [Chloroflexota bacterium]